MNALTDFMIAYFESVIRYFLFAGVPFFIFYIWKKEKLFASKIQQKYPEQKQIITEIKYSLLTCVIFGAVGFATYKFAQMGITLVYDTIADYGWLWFFASILLMLVLHDTYFYWTHRMMHLKALFPLFHKTHHASHNPTPWSAFAFSPLEALVQIGILPIIAFVIPAHPSAIIAFFVIMTLINTMGHSGHETFPAGFTKGWWQWYNTSTHHNMHHRFGKCNYGIYFNLWDRIMKTNHKEYHEYFENVKSRIENQSPLRKVKTERHESEKAHAA